jgi:ABC-type nitrate/sulfonate/bicarbonate transport system substrate-binding protein
MKKFRPLAAIAAISTAALVLTGCASDSAEQTESYGELGVQFSWIKNAEFAGEYFADTNGYYQEAGFSSVNFIAGPTATAAVVLSGEVLVGLSDAIAVTPVILEEGAPLKIIGATYQKNPFTILSLKDGGNIQTPQDLIGKRIGVQAGGNETLFDALLAANGIDASQVTKVPVEYDPAPLVNGEVDGFLAYITNESITVQNLGYEVTNLLFAENGLPFVAEAFIVTQDSIDNRREELKAFLYATIRGWKDAIANPDEGARLAVEVYGKDLGLDINKEKQQSKTQNDLLVLTDETRANGLLTISKELQDLNIQTLARAGYTITAEQLFDMSLLEEVYAEHPELLE